MASTYVNDLRLNEMATGDGSGTWGTTTNTNLELIAEAFSYGTEVITTNADTHATVIADGSTDPGRSLYLKYTGTLDSDCTITIGPNTVSKVWIIENGTSGSQNINISQGSGANITIPAGDTKVVYSDGAGAGAAFFDAFASLSVVDLKVQDDLTVTGDIDVDGTTNLDVVDIDGAVDMASSLTVGGAFTSLGIDDNATSTAITIDSSENVGIGITPTAKLDLLIDTDKRLTFSGGIGEIGNVAGFQSINSAGSALEPFGIRAEDIRFATGSSERLRIDSDGNVGIGTSSPGTSNTAGISLIPGTTSFVSATGSNGSAVLLLGNNNGGSNSATDTTCGSIAFKARFNGTFGGGNDVASIVGTYTGDGTTRSGAIRFLTINAGAEAERMRIDSSGNLLVGTTSTADTDPGGKIFSSGIMVQGVPDTGLVDMHDFYRGTAGSLTRVGNIRTNGSSTSYNTSSDYRLKEDDVPMTGATERVKALRPINFAWKVDGSRVDGFLAHEVQEIVPEAISGTKDAMTAEVLYVEGDELPEGKSIGDVKTASVPDYQGIDQSKLVPLLTKALQEALTKIEQLETRLETLENA
jgi:hypothetical protein